MKILKCTVISALLFSLLAACSTLPRGFELTPDQALVHQASGTAFPEQLASFSRSVPVSYNSEGTDISVNFQSKGLLPSNLDMYVFPASNINGPIGLTNQHSDFVRSVMKMHPGVVVESDADVQVTQAGELQEAKQATFTYSEVFGGVRQKVFSILVEFEYKGWFISYRMDTPVAGKEEALGLLLDFIRVAPLPSKSYTLQAADFFGLVKFETPQNVQAAINKGADVNERDKNGATALMGAAMHNPNPEVITTLLKAGAKIEVQNKFGVSALMYAAADNPNPEVITTLLKAGADLKAQSKIGLTALMFAAGYNPNSEVTIALLNAGADAKVKDNAGKTAFDYVQKNEKLKGTDALKQLEEASK